VIDAHSDARGTGGNEDDQKEKKNRSNSNSVFSFWSREQSGSLYACGNGRGKPRTSWRVVRSLAGRSLEAARKVKKDDAVPSDRSPRRPAHRCPCSRSVTVAQHPPSLILILFVSPTQLCLTFCPVRARYVPPLWGTSLRCTRGTDSRVSRFRGSLVTISRESRQRSRTDALVHRSCMPMSGSPRRSDRHDSRAIKRRRARRIGGYGINLIVWHALIRRVKMYCVAGKP